MFYFHSCGLNSYCFWQDFIHQHYWWYPGTQWEVVALQLCSKDKASQMLDLCMFYTVHTSPQFNYINYYLTRGGSVKSYHPNRFCRATAWFNLVWSNVLRCTRSCGSRSTTVQRMILTDVLGASTFVFTYIEGRYFHWGWEEHVSNPHFDKNVDIAHQGHFPLSQQLSFMGRWEWIEDFFFPPGCVSLRLHRGSCPILWLVDVVPAVREEEWTRYPKPINKKYLIYIVICSQYFPQRNAIFELYFWE